MNNQGRFKQRLAAGEAVIGTCATVPAPALVDVLGHAGADFCMIDTEHGALDAETVTQLVMIADGAGVAPIVRVGDNDERLILRALDVGATGVQVPQINTIDDARKVIRAAKYAPLGERGLSTFTRAGNYFKDGSPNHTQRQNDETLVIAHIEGKQGLDNLDEILTLEGIDVYFLGPYDISQSLGVPGEVRSPVVEQALVSATQKARAAGRSVGSFAKDPEMARWMLDLGIQYMLYGVDTTLYLEACERFVGELRRNPT
jgi:2-keto-3-deoxy-L-rhamnonate aldolase RhmA